MALQPSSWTSFDGDGLPGTEYWSLFLLLLAVTAVQVSLVPVLETVTRVVSVLLGRRFVEAAATTVVLLVAGGVAYAGLARVTGFSLDRFELARTGVSLAGLLLVSLYYLLGEGGSPVSGTGLLTNLASTASMGVLTVAYARFRGFDLRLDRPGPGSKPAVGIAFLGPLWVVGVAVAATHLVPGLSFRWLSPGFLSPASLPAVGFAADIAIPSVVAAVGTGLVFHGAVHEGLRQHAAAATAVAVATTLVGAYRLAVTGVPGPATGLPLLVAVPLVLGVLVAVAVLVGRLRVAIDGSPTAASPLWTGALLGAVVVSVLALAFQLAVPVVSSLFAFAVAYAAVVALAAVTYERTRSVWVPVLAYATFQLSVGGAQYLQLAAGGF